MPTKRTSSQDSLTEFFGSWRLWLLGALIGALLAWAAYQIFPPNYRAQATVVVDNNLEEAWQFFPDRQIFQFLQRETERLEQLAWSDSVLQTVATADVSAHTVQQLRGDILRLSQPSDGGWHFYADAADLNEAHLLASAWAQAFVDAAHTAVEASPDMAAARAALSAELQKPDPDSAQIQTLTQQIDALDERTKGISPYTELYVSEAADLPTERALSLATYLLIGSVAGALAAPLYVLLRPAPRKRR